MAVGATKITPTQLVPGDKERIDRTMRILEQDVARLEKSLAERRSKEGQEATRNAILSKRARIHRLNSYLQRAMPSQVIARSKPIPSAHVPTNVPPKGSALLKDRMEEARKQLKEETAKPSVQQIAVETKVDLKPLPKVVDEKSLQKFNETLEDNKKAVHEMKMRVDALERQKKLDLKKKIVEVPKGPPLSPLEMKQEQDIPKQINHLQTRYRSVSRTISHFNRSSRVRSLLSQFRRTRDRRLLQMFPRDFSLNVALQLTPVPGRFHTRIVNGRRVRVNVMTHPDMKNIPQKVKSLNNQLVFLRKKKEAHHHHPALHTHTSVAGLENWQKSEMVKPKREPTSLTMQSIPNEVLTLVQQMEGELEGLRNIPGVPEIIEDAKRIIISNRYTSFQQFIQNPQAKVIEEKLMRAAKSQGMNLGGVNLGGHAHRPYAMPRNLGIITVLKQRQLQKNNRPEIESTNMAGLRRYTAAQYARESRVKAEQEQEKEVANLAGAFSQTRAVMERMVR